MSSKTGELIECGCYHQNEFLEVGDIVLTYRSEAESCGMVIK